MRLPNGFHEPDDWTGGMRTSDRNRPICRQFVKADARTRTGDPFITSEVLYQLSYVGACRDFLDLAPPLPGLVLRRCCKIWVGLCVRQAYLTLLGLVHCG